MNKKILLYAIMLSILFIMSGCNTNGYRSISVHNSIARFSFEYSTYYRDIEGPTELDGLTSVRLLAPKKHAQSSGLDPFGNKTDTVTVEYVPATIKVLIYDARDRNGTAREDMENWLGKFKDSFNIIERSTMVVDGVTGEYVYFSSSPLLSLTKTADGGNPTQYTRSIYFDHDGLVWQIEAEYESEMVERVYADFDHIVQTFKILD